MTIKTVAANRSARVISGTPRRKLDNKARVLPILHALNEESGAGENLPDSVKGALHALQRAAVRARQVAQQTGTDLIVMRSGQVVRVSPQQKTTP